MHLAGGHCEECGSELGRDFHADYFMPWIKGGATDVINGRALCPKCNLRKGSKMLAHEPRRWQTQAKAAFYAKRNLPNHSGTFLLHATMGAGKTSFSCQLCSEMVGDRSIRRVIVVTTSRNLCSSWVATAHRFGIQLEENWSVLDGPPPPNFNGLVITYAKLCSPGTAEFLRRWCAQEPTLVILDEPHHLGDDSESSWGPNARLAFEPAKERLLITGTPWRSDGTAIPFVEYDEAGIVKCDYRYSYSEALRDVVCRFVFFPTIDGSARYGLDGSIKAFQTLADVPDAHLSKVLKTIFQPDGEWMRGTLTLAHKELMEMRANGHPDAGGLVVVSDTREAGRVVKELRRLTKSEVLIVTSKEEDSEGIIRRFREGAAPWLVAVQMVSEGVDIPRLRVGVYATTVRTRLAFRQFIGRFVRVIEGMEDQAATVYIPWIEPYTSFAKEIEKENLEALRESVPGDGKTKNGDGKEHTFDPGASGFEQKEIIAGPVVFMPSEVEIARGYAETCGLSISGMQAALLIRLATGSPVGPGSITTSVPSPSNPEPDSKIRKERRKEGAKLQRRLAYVRYGDNASNTEFQAIGAEIKARFGIHLIKADPQQLEQITEWLVREIHKARTQ